MALEHCLLVPSSWRVLRWVGRWGVWLPAGLSSGPRPSKVKSFVPWLLELAVPLVVLTEVVSEVGLLIVVKQTEDDAEVGQRLPVLGLEEEQKKRWVEREGLMAEVERLTMKPEMQEQLRQSCLSLAGAS